MRSCGGVADRRCFSLSFLHDIGQASSQVVAAAQGVSGPSMGAGTRVGVTTGELAGWVTAISEYRSAMPDW